MRYYVYLLLDDTEKGCYDNEFCSIEFKPFYVGKGDFLSKNKIERHLIHYHEVKRNIKKIVKIYHLIYFLLFAINLFLFCYWRIYWTN